MISRGELKCIGCDTVHPISIDLKQHNQWIKKASWDYLIKRWGCPRELRTVKPSIIPYNGCFEYYCNKCRKHYHTRFIYFNRSPSVIGCYREDQEDKYQIDLGNAWRKIEDIRSTYKRGLREEFIKTFSKLVLGIHKL
jgi:hypothetical protein